jgi:Spy/CpxP family protein refolding chaperone
MKFTKLIVSATAIAALALPVAGLAQQTPPDQPPPQNQMQDQQQGGQRQRTTPNKSDIERFWNHRLGSLNLSNQQQQQVESLITQYSQQHPEGSPLDRDANRSLRDQIRNVLTPDQQTQLKQQMKTLRQEYQQRMEQDSNGNQQQGPPAQNPPAQNPPR